MKEPKRYLVTAALPYANGLKHIGHLAGAYIPADIYVRYLRAQKRDVVYVCGSDEHGTAIPIQAMKEGTTSQAIIDKYHEIIKQNFEDVGPRFAEEARQIHQGKAEERPIHGTATAKETADLAEEGIPFVTLPKPELDS